MKTNIRLLLTFLCLSIIGSKAQAVSPPPDGGYPGFNTAEGSNALQNLTTGGYNTALGYFSLRAVGRGAFNTAVGAGTLLANTADGNTATGAAALLLNTSGFQNTATGAFALLYNSTGQSNTANGFDALFNNTEGSGNTANGVAALFSNTTGGGNTAVGAGALFSNITDAANTAVGVNALSANVAGSNNTAVGTNALLDLGNGYNNIALGDSAGGALQQGNNNILIGNFGDVELFNSIFIGREGVHNFTVIAGIYGQPTQNGLPVYIDANHRLGTTTSSRRFKQDVKPMDKASDSLLALRPVTFRYNKAIDPAGRRQFGLVAEDVEKVSPDLVVCDKKGKPYAVRYDQVNAMLLNEFLKEHRQVQEQKTTIAQLKSAMAQQQKQVEALTAGLQKVSAQLELSKSAPQTVLNTD
jgi:trimeric autotransporter adhesin